MAGKQKILIIDNSLYLTGALRSILNMTEALKGEYGFCFAISDKSRVGEDLEKMGYTVFRIPFRELSKSPSAALAYVPSLMRNVRRILQIVRREGISIIHVNDLFNQLGTAVKLLRPSVPVIYHVRLLASSYIGKLYGLFSFLIRQWADKLICVSPAVLSDIGKSAKAVVIYDSMQTSENLPPWSGLRQPDRATILYLGNIVCGKGQQWGVLALADVAKEYPLVRMEFVGGVHSEADVRYKEELQQLAEANAVGGNIHFSGTEKEIEAAMKRSDIVLNMSESESFSMVCLEAMLYGVPLVAADSGGPRDITDDGRMAPLVPNKDYKKAAQAIIDIIRQPEAARQKAIAAKAYAAEKYALERSAGQLKAIYEEVIGS